MARHRSAATPADIVVAAWLSRIQAGESDAEPCISWTGAVDSLCCTPSTARTVGRTPTRGSAADHQGNLYGMTGNGGDLNACGGFGCGVVFKLDRRGNESVLYNFTGGADGSTTFAGVVRDAAGNLYGTTAFGGNLSGCGGSGCGVVFKVDPRGKETVLYTFTGGTDGANPEGNLLLDEEGNLYGTASGGGDPTCQCGVVFEIALHGGEHN